MKIPWTVIAILVSTSLMAFNNEGSSSGEFSSVMFDENWESHSEEDLHQRIQNIELPFSARVTPHVKSQIKRYVTNGYRDTERMLGRSFQYFPVFEHYLRLHGLPHELKYLPMIESRLSATAQSGVGASGLWQFIPATGRHYGLKINGTVDERLDAYKSTEAAAKLLSTLYDDFQDWSLVLAAYNCGPARVKKAIRLAGCRNFYDISPYLPKETQRYIPRFIAAAYIANYYNFHQIDPVFPKFKAQELSTIKVHDYTRFQDIAYACGVSASTLHYLNPGFVAGVIPSSQSGYYVNVPASAAPAFRKLLTERALAKGVQGIQFSIPEGTFKSTYMVRAGESLQSLARLCNCNIKEIMFWNNLQNEEVVVNQELVLYLPKETVFYRP